ncbi:beta-ketoacyl synthase N-terminal-like domain-containing protein [Paenibacillus sp. BR2-3]|uniref:beta-ketoacyl synthase N-terminal-like domain-containing protein n=1 Tax=Paenibacillus sp. BR2-3 TaxID=3048494 RepID=UPI003977431B
MTDSSHEMSRILERIKKGEIDPEQGYSLIRHLKSSPVQPEGNENKQSIDIKSQGSHELHDFAVQYLKGLLSQVIGLEAGRINARQSLEDYGVDSVAIMEINNLLDKDFQNLPKTLLFEYGNLNDLADYFVQNHRDLLDERAGINRPQPSSRPEKQPQISPPEVKREEERAKYRTFSTPGKQPTQTVDKETPKDDGIAIIGISGAFPNARNLQEFWNNLKNGEDCITEIPLERWDHSRYYDPEKGKKGKVYSKWGGFIDEYNCFDPLFFQMTPRDAEQLDPQERLFLESAHSAIEDGGYTRQSLWNSKTGVFVGVMYGHYQLYGAEETAKGNTLTLSSSYASIANRVSYFFNFNGPSIALDTMCSSSLTALHLACESIYRGDSEIAIAGGVNVTIHPDKYLFLCNQRFASSEGKCRAFGDGGDGYVPGEGVGALLLKPVSKAIQDGDNIYGVIRASSINHGGKTNGYTVPNPNAQAAIISESLRKSGIHPRAISYVEAHGTGTSLGDPIEISGLTKAFRASTTDTQYCAIGSVKSNVGHLESAAGVVSIIKVLLQMKHKQLVPSLHSEVLNPNISFEDTPFYVQRNLEEWKPSEFPRLASVSSFGAGGTNVHVILEEYNQKNILPGKDQADPQIFVLSAKNRDRLTAYAEQIINFIDEHTIRHVITTETISSDTLRKYVITDITACFLQLASLPSQISAQESIEEYGLSKEELISVADAIYEAYPVRLPMGLLTGSGTIESIAELILDQLESVISAKYNQGTKAEENSVDFYNFRLEDLIFTLQIGRETMDERLAMVISSIAELREKLGQFVNGKRNSTDVYAGNIRSGSEIQDVFTESAEGEAFLLSLVHSGKLSQLCRLWSSGVNFKWQLLYTGQKPNKISLPTYPFERKRYWYDSSEPKANTHNSPSKALAAVIDSNESVFEEQCYKKTLTVQDSFLRDHVIQGQMLLPGVVYLEMAWRAGLLSSREWKVQSITDVKWRKTLALPAIKDSQDVYISLVSQESGIEASIYALQENGQKMLYCTCTLNYTHKEAEPAEVAGLDIQHIIHTSDSRFSRDHCYEAFSAHGMEYGDNLRVIEAVYTGNYGTLSKLVLPEHTHMPLSDYVIHPGFADGAMQTALYSVLSGQQKKGTFVPFALDTVEVYKALTPISYCLVTPSNSFASEHQGLQFDLLLFDESGNLAVKFLCLSGRDLTPPAPKTEAGAAANADYASLDHVLTKLLAGEAGIDEVERMLEGI